MNNLLVMKFGGTSLMSGERIMNAAKIVAAAALSGKKLVVVVSAMGHTTDELITLSKNVTSAPDKRELDALMATGEQVSATLMAMALQSLGCKARSFSGAQSGIKTDNCFGDAKVETVNKDNLLARLKEGVIPVVTGFQGISATGDVTTIGRGGSDTTAIALAAALRAERCDIYTDVDGIYSADPRIVKSAIKLGNVSYSEMLELARNGAQVLNARSVEMARDKQVIVRVRSTFEPGDEGTLITAKGQESHGFTGVALNSNVDCIEIELEKLELAPNRSLRSFRAIRFKTKHCLLKSLADVGISAEIVDPVRPNPFKILLFMNKIDTAAAMQILQKTTLSVRRMTINSNLSSIVLVAAEVTVKYEVGAEAAMLQHKIPFTARAWHHQRLTMLVPSSMGGEAVNILHSHFADEVKLRA